MGTLRQAQGWWDHDCPGTRWAASAPARRRVAGAEIPGGRSRPARGSRPSLLLGTHPRSSAPPHLQSLPLDPLQRGPPTPFLCKPQLNSAPTPNLPPRAPQGVGGRHLGLSRPLLLIPAGPPSRTLTCASMPPARQLHPGGEEGGTGPLPISPRQPHLPQHPGVCGPLAFLLHLVLPTPWPTNPCSALRPEFQVTFPRQWGASRVSAWPRRLPSPAQGRLAQPSQARAPSERCCWGELAGAAPGEWGGPQQLQPCPHPPPRAPRAPVPHLPPTCSLAGSGLCPHPPPPPSPAALPQQ